MTRPANRHVEHLLAAYVEGQLSPRRVQAVRQHTMTCASCRGKLAQHERLAADLHLALGQNSIPRSSQVEAWWQQVAIRQRAPVHRPALATLVPALLTILVILSPLLVSTGSARLPAESLRQSSLSSAQELHEPPAVAQQNTADFIRITPGTDAAYSSSTPAAFSTPLPAAPVPAAPTLSGE